jgi:hypothetical protein
MEGHELLTNCMWGWLIAIAVTAYSQWKIKAGSVGLGAMYLMNLFINHFLGGFIYSLSWYSTAMTIPVEKGFLVTTYGLLSFTVGSAIVSPWLVTLLSKKQAVIVRREINPALPKIYLCIALVTYFLLIPVLGSIPTLGAILRTGWTLMVVGLGLLVKQAYDAGDKRQVVFWLASTIFLPLTTILTAGFIGYGAVALLIVLFFTASFYRPRWHSILAITLGVYLGLCVYVTYMRDRNDIRDAVWGGQAYATRIDRLLSTFSEFELIDFNNQNHLGLIDDRLNQNFLVGAAVNYLEEGKEEFAKGETIWNSILALVPRIIWPNKPYQAGSGLMVTQYTGIPFAEGTSVGIGQVMEFYVNFGNEGVIAGFFILGVLLGLIDSRAAARLKENDWPGFAFYFLPGLGLLQVGGSLGEMTTTAGASMVAAAMANYILSKYAGWQKAKIHKQKLSPVTGQPLATPMMLPEGDQPRQGKW